MLKKYSRSGTALSARQLMAISGGNMNVGPHCNESFPCPTSCRTTLPGNQSWECQDGSCVHVICPDPDGR